ncbi:hypothetical protein phiPsa267_087 [Pseudomonas phage phiPsa267]|uniref:Uncharacterized protein n=3 Tax=Otagovirus TaxID=2560197 RepID=A0A7G9V0Y5_9CAUD|nr:hypothetical protein QGX18_gp142 [Pseudomonas phage phiPsa347]YP_010767697.1 hypothetical protein QGX19_gp143 [Pseudomonas phage phiPsa267]YP_010767871.1 hypothetical protein QGX20_gp137 [Pseudomonas phage phiPsa300]QNN99940.1 hypothetical protein phiPsa267_087 [Pseudomonas phage phiPsa267]QNO00114.1 hypothetical protein phiPsa300_085 [Pseudomonas phage phiPsa300]QNO00458.1 hypothetical protein phiPsa347_086 [Pseudomonas phage phiPsa347]
MFPYETEFGTTITGVKDAYVSCPDGSHITCTIVTTGGHFGDKEVELPFTATPNDPMKHGVEIYNFLKKKKTTKKYVKPAPTLLELKDEFDELMVDITLGLASDEELARAKELRVQIKELSAV